MESKPCDYLQAIQQPLPCIKKLMEKYGREELGELERILENLENLDELGREEVSKMTKALQELNGMIDKLQQRMLKPELRLEEFEREEVVELLELTEKLREKPGTELEEGEEPLEKLWEKLGKVEHIGPAKKLKEKLDK